MHHKVVGEAVICDVDEQHSQPALTCRDYSRLPVTTQLKHNSTVTVSCSPSSGRCYKTRLLSLFVKCFLHICYLD